MSHEIFATNADSYSSLEAEILRIADRVGRFIPLTDFRHTTRSSPAMEVIGTQLDR